MKYNAPKQFAWLTPPSEQHPKGTFHRSGKPMLDDEMMKAAARHHWDHACYESVFQFPAWNGGRLTAEIAKSAIIDCVYLDFDCKEDPLRAIRDAGAIADFVGHSTSWFSGMKGAGVLLHCDPVDILPDLKGATLTWLALILQDMFKSITTMDMAVTGDVNRVHRIIDSKHPGTGLHAIGLTGRELRTLTLEEITFMAHGSRNKIQLPKPSKWVSEQLQTIEGGLIKERINHLVEEGMLSGNRAYQLRIYLLDPTCKADVWNFIKKLEDEVHRIRMKKLTSLPPTSGGRTKEETWLINVVEIFKTVGRAANIQPKGSNTSTSASEQEARAHLVLLAVNDCDWDFSRVCDMFTGADDYNRAITEGQVKSLMRR